MRTSAARRVDAIPAGQPVRTVTDREFTLFQALIHREAGIYLTRVKKALLAGRLARRLRELGLSSLEAYYHHVEQAPDELQRMLDCICTNETSFFREPRQFEFLKNVVLPAWMASAEAGARPRRVRAWSAACSTGEEPYSLAMLLLHELRRQAGWEIEILATDLSTRALEQARLGIWALEKKKKIPHRFLRAFMLRGTGTQEGKMAAGPSIRSVIRFGRLNLHAGVWPVAGRFDLIFCRNVLIYFDVQTKERVVRRLFEHLSPSGYLLVGHAESLNCLTERAQNIAPTVYAARATPRARQDGDRGRRATPMNRRTAAGASPP